MLTTTIKFVGLIVTTLLSSPNPPGAELIMGNFPISNPPHVRLIAWPEGTRVESESTWPKEPVGFTTANGTRYEYSLVGVENVTITGSTEPFVNLLGKIPHLTCCCPQFNDGFRPAWGFSAYTGADKMSAFFTFTHGTYFTVTESTNAISTALAIGDSGKITFEGLLPGIVKKIVIDPSLKPSTVLIVGNTPLAVLEGQHIHPPDTNDFLNYYLMGVDTASCTANPSAEPPNPCAPSDKGGCPRLSATHPTPAKSAARHQSRARKLASEARRLLKKNVALMVDVDCSSSQWP